MGCPYGELGVISTKMEGSSVYTMIVVATTW